jgi:2-polyprenyl-3-methyl-5-hydroxy-6-metoxy-1,4-benzoquinol methylase
MRIAGLESLRRENFRTILGELGEFTTVQGARILDVGSAYGWFLEEAAEAGALATGIEPDARVASCCTEEVRIGLFPDVLDTVDKFDVIAFNDVLEHLPDVRGALGACREHLKPEGLLSINIPTADGLAFKTSCVLARAGIHGPYQRLWQYALPSPHIHYFRTDALARLVESCGFVVVKVRELPALRRDGLWQRMRTVNRLNIVNMFAFAGMGLATDVLNHPRFSDIVLLIAQPA